MTSDRMLKRWYDRYNREFFGGELPDDVPVYWEPCQAYGETFHIEPDGVGIRINPCCKTIWTGGKQAWAKLTLLHEMCHVKLWNGRVAQHGRKFNDEIARLCQFSQYRKLL